jgi:hypothetical protein
MGALVLAGTNPLGRIWAVRLQKVSLAFAKKRDKSRRNKGIDAHTKLTPDDAQRRYGIPSNLTVFAQLAFHARVLRTGRRPMGPPQRPLAAQKPSLQVTHICRQHARVGVHAPVALGGGSALPRIDSTVAVAI